MHCNIVEDLLPLYADHCCSEESRQAVQAHLAECPDCRRILEAMERPLPTTETKPAKPGRIQEWKASVLQSVLLFAAFGAVTFGVAMESKIGSLDLLNGFWAMALVVPATGFLLSLANWYFARLYKSRGAFSWACCGVTAGAIVLCGLWALNHYQWPLEDGVFWIRLLICSGFALVPVGLCALSKLLSDWYARLLGKE